MATHSSTLAGKPHGWRSLVGCSPWDREESDTTEWLHFHFSLSCIGEGNGNPLQSSCLENPRDGGAWWAALYGVAQSWTRLKWLSSSSSSITMFDHLMRWEIPTLLRVGNLFGKRKSLRWFWDQRDLRITVPVYLSSDSPRDWGTKILIVLLSLNYHKKRNEFIKLNYERVWGGSVWPLI